MPGADAMAVPSLRRRAGAPAGTTSESTAASPIGPASAPYRWRRAKKKVAAGLRHCGPVRRFFFAKSRWQKKKHVEDSHRGAIACIVMAYVVMAYTVMAYY